MAKTDAVRLQHMIDAAQKALTFTDGRSRQDLDDDEMLALAVVRLVEIVMKAGDGGRGAIVMKCWLLPLFG